MAKRKAPLTDLLAAPGALSKPAAPTGVTGPVIVPPKPNRRKPTINLFSPQAKTQLQDTLDASKAQADKHTVFIKQRQTVLRAHGFSVSVDGVWGPESQHAWTVYVYRRKRDGRRGATIAPGAAPPGVAGPVAPPPITQPPAAPPAAPPGVQGPLVLTPEQAHAHGTAVAKKLAVDAKKQAAAQAPPGVSGPTVPTQAQKTAAAAEARLAAQKKHVQALAHRLANAPDAAAKMPLHDVAAVLLDPETKLKLDRPEGATVAQTWLNAHGYKTPKSGVYDRATHDALLHAFHDAQQAQHKAEVRAVVKQLYVPAGLHAGDRPYWWPGDGSVPQPGELLDMLKAGGLQGAQIRNAIVDHLLTGQSAFDAIRHAQLLKQAALVAPASSAVVLERLFPGSSSNFALAHAAAGSPVADPSLTGNRLDAAVYQFRAEIHALYGATSPADFNNRLMFITQQAEKIATHHSRSFMRHFYSAIGGGLHYAIAPGQFLRTALVYDTMRGMQLADQSILGMDENAREITWEDARAALGQKTTGTYDGDVKSPGVIRDFVFTLVADPLNFVAPLRLGSSALRYGGAEVMGRYVLRDAAGGAGGFLSKSLVYNKGTWSKLGAAKAVGRTIPGHGAIASTTAAQKLFAFGNMMTALKPELLDRTRRAATLSMRHLFTNPRNSVPGMTDKIVHAGIKGELIHAAIEGREAVKAVLLNPRFMDMITPLIDHKASIYIDAAHTDKSSIGAGMVARHIEETRVQVIHGKAAQAERDWRATADTTGMTKGQIEDAAQKVYTDVLRKAGVYIKGGGDRELVAQVDREVAHIADQWENAILPAIHDILEDAAAHGGYKLFDQAGLWAERGGEAAKLVRAGGRDAFATHKLIPVPNPLHDVPHSWTEASDAIQSELRRTTSRLHWRQSREILGGDATKTGFDLETELAKAHADIEGAWVKKGNGKYYDTRPTIDVPDLYARHLDESNLGGRLDTASDNPLAAGLTNDPSLVSPFDQAVGRMIWDLGGRQADHAQFTSVSFQLQAAALQSQVALRRGYDASMSKLLAKDGAAWMALSTAQTWPLRTLYRGLKGATDIWIFASLALRPGWVVRNVVDNVTKSIIEGVRDPRLFYQGFKNPGRVTGAIGTFLDTNVQMLRYTVDFLDKLFGTNALHHFDAITDELWKLPNNALRAIFNAQGVDIDEAVIEGMRLTPGGDRVINAPFIPNLTDEQIRALGVSDDLAKSIAKLARGDAKGIRKGWVNTVWNMSGQLPEDFSKRILYRDTVIKTTKELAGSGFSDVEVNLIAAERATQKIEQTLFDYSKVTVIEDNLRVFFPFIQFWRKNTAFWIRNSVEKPWLPVAMQKWEDARANANKDWPEWMRRYVSSHEIIDAAAVIPGLGDVVAAMLPDDGQFDPLSMSSFSRIYRTFKGENPNMPDDKKGMAFFGPILDMLDSYGPGTSPLIRKPAEAAGIASQRSWQTLFPEFGPAIALTRDFWMNRQSNPFYEAARQAGLLGMGVNSDKIASDFNYYVQQEMIGQQARGEPPNRAKAEHQIKSWFINQNLIGYFTGFYFRRATPQDIVLSKMWEDLTQGDKPFSSLTPKQDALMKEWAKRRMDRLSFDQYVSLVPIIQAFYRQGSFAAAEAYKQAHPEIIQYVDSSFKGKPFDSLVRSMDTLIHTQQFFQVSEIFNSLHLPYEAKKQALAMVMTPALKAAWAKNDTPAQIRDRMVQGEVHRMLNHESTAYFAIPDNDYDAKREYLAQHPELVRSWAQNNSLVDDFGGIIHDANAALRDQYFALADAKKWDEAEALTRAHPFLWEDTKHAYQYDPETGQKKIQFMSKHARAYMAAKPSLDQFDALVNRVGKKKAFAWLYSSDSELATTIKDYFHHWGKHKTDEATQGALDIYDGLKTKEAKKAWLAIPGEQQNRVKAFFDAHATKEQKQINAAFDIYNSLPKDKRHAWLDGSSPQAVQLKAYLHAHETPAQKAVDHAFTVFNSLKGDKAKQRAWLNGPTTEAKKLKAYLDAHATPEQKEINKLFDHYNALDKDARHKWLNSHDPRAVKLKAYLHAHETPEQKAVDAAFKHYNSLGKEAGRKWLDSSDPEAKKLKAYLRLHETPEQKAVDGAFQHYNSLGKAARRKWLSSSDPEAKKLKAYFDAHQTPEQKKVSRAFDHYGRIDKDSRSAWLHSDDPDAVIVRAAIQKSQTPAERELHHDLDAYRKLTPAKRALFLKTNDPAAKRIRSFFAKLDATKIDRARAYLRVKQDLRAYWAMPADHRQAWLHSGTERADAVLQFFDTFGRSADANQHAVDFLHNKATLDRYSKMTPEEKRAFLHGDTRAAADLLAYFKKYSKAHQYERAFYKLHPDLIHGTPEQVRRMQFWKQYFALTPDQRPAFTHDHAEEYGIFIYGSFGEQEMDDRAKAFERLAGKMTPKQEAYLYAKPLLDFYFTLPKDERPLFARANPEVSDYLDKYSSHSITGDAKLDHKIEAYFKLPASSQLRATFLANHPELQTYFDKHSTPAEVAMRNILTQYFGLPKEKKAEFLQLHPEINAYFDNRRQAQRNSENAYQAFDTSDPRLTEYFRPAQSLIEEAAWMRAQLRQSAINALSPEGIDAGHGTRAVFKPSTGKHGDSRGSGVAKEAAYSIQDARVRRSQSG
jgi:hypothetical protein